jgi:putative ABC transport system permease protein
MRITGVLAPAGAPEDFGVLTDVRTIWVIDGFGHGHDDLEESPTGVLSREEDRIVANASVVEYNEITDENINSFHFHGDLSAYPITGIIIDPFDQRSEALLLGRLGSDASLQVVRPAETIADMLRTVLTVQHLVVAALVTVAIAAGAMGVLVFLLSLRIRRRELQTMVKIGASPGWVAALIGGELLTTLAIGGALAALLLWPTISYAPTIVRAFLQQ